MTIVAGAPVLSPVHWKHKCPPDSQSAVRFGSRCRCTALCILFERRTTHSRPQTPDPSLYIWVKYRLKERSIFFQRDTIIEALQPDVSRYSPWSWSSNSPEDDLVKPDLKRNRNRPGHRLTNPQRIHHRQWSGISRNTMGTNPFWWVGIWRAGVPLEKPDQRQTAQGTAQTARKYTPPVSIVPVPISNPYRNIVQRLIARQKSRESETIGQIRCYLKGRILV